MKQIITFLLFMCSILVTAQDECFQVLRLSSRNYTDTETKSIMASNIYKSHCGKSSSASSLSIGMDSNKTAKLVSSVFGITGSATNSVMKQFCDNYESGFYGKQEYSQSTNLVVEEAIRAWASCQKLKNQDVSFDINDGGHRITFSVKQNSGKAINLTGVDYDETCLECNISKGKKTVKADKFSSERIQDGRILNITCERIKKESDSLIFYPNTDIAINTDLGNLTIPIPAKATPRLVWLNEITNELDALSALLKNKIDSTNSKINNLKKHLEASYLGNNEILFGRIQGSPTPFTDNSYSYGKGSINIFAQSDGKNGIVWRDISGNSNNIFDKTSKYHIHILTANGNYYIGLFEFGQTISKKTLSRKVGNTKYMSFIAIKNKA